MNTPANHYRYIVTSRLAIQEAVPLLESTFTVEWDRESTGQMDYKNTMPNKIVFVKEVFQTLLNLEKSIYRCDYVSILVQRFCAEGGDWQDFFTGRMSFNDGIWDLDRCELEIKLDDIKTGAGLDDNKSVDVNLLSNINFRRTVFLNPIDITVEKVTYSDSGGYLSEPCQNGVVWGGGGVPAAQGWAVYSYELTVNKDPSGNPTLNICNSTTHWAREVKTVVCGSPAPGPEWILVEDTCPGGGQKYARLPRLYGCKYVYGDISGLSQTTTYTCNIVGDADARISIDNGMALEDVVTLFLEMFQPDLTFVSNFFQINPDVPSTTNYVTGQPSKTRHITIFQKSDVKRPDVSGNATKAVLSFEHFFTALIEMFNLRWRIVGNTLRMEHVSYFTKNYGMDLTLPRWAPWMVGKNKYSYNTAVIPIREEFKFMEASGEDFVGYPIIYSGGCVSATSRDNVIQHLPGDVTTDIEFVLSHPESDSEVVSDNGFVFMACDFDGTNFFVISEAPYFGGSTLNNSLAWAQLQRDYYKWDRPLSNGVMNQVPTAFYSVQPTKKGEQFTIPLCCSDTFNPDDKIKTVLGDGVVDKAVYNFKSQTLTLDLLYPSDKNLFPNIAPSANNDVATGPQDTDLLIDVLANDYDPDGVIRDVLITHPPLHGTAVVIIGNLVRYTPDAGYTGNDVFVYKAVDNWGEPSNAAIVSINITGPNPPPDAVNDSFDGVKNTTLNAPAPGVFGNDTGTFSLNSFDATSAHGGTVVVNADGSVVYTPPAGYVGLDTFTYTITGVGGTDTATATVNVRDPNNPVAANDGIYVTTRNRGYDLAAPGILANDTTPVGTLAAVAGTFATVNGGSITIATDGSFHYTPATDYVGLDSYVYTVGNGTGTDTAAIQFRVLPDIYVKIQQVSLSDNTLTQTCSDGPKSAGDTKAGVFKVFYYSNPAGSIPFDVTGLGLKINIRITGTYYSAPGSYNIDSVVDATGTENTLFGGTYTYYRNIYNCDMAVVYYTNEAVHLQGGNYITI
jgi:Bacterial Ig domain